MSDPDELRSSTHALPDWPQKPRTPCSTSANRNLWEITGIQHNSTTNPATHRCAMPALRTAQEMAFTAVPRALSSVVSSPVPLALLPSSITKRVIVTTLVSKAPRSDMAADGPFSVEAGGTFTALKCRATRNLVEWERREPIQSWGRGVALLETRALCEPVWPVMKWSSSKTRVWANLKGLMQSCVAQRTCAFLAQLR